LEDVNVGGTGFMWVWVGSCGGILWTR